MSEEPRSLKVPVGYNIEREKDGDSHFSHPIKVKREENIPSLPLPLVLAPGCRSATLGNHIQDFVASFCQDSADIIAP